MFLGFQGVRILQRSEACRSLFVACACACQPCARPRAPFCRCSCSSSSSRYRTLLRGGTTSVTTKIAVRCSCGRRLRWCLGVPPFSCPSPLPRPRPQAVVACPAIAHVFTRTLRELLFLHPFSFLFGKLSAKRTPGLSEMSLLMEGCHPAVARDGNSGAHDAGRDFRVGSFNYP